MSVKDQDKPFEGILGNSTELKILEHLIACEGLEFNIKELARSVDISRYMVAVGIKRFEKWNMVKVEKRVGNVKLYSLNSDSEAVKRLLEFSNCIIDEISREISEKSRKDLTTDCRRSTNETHALSAPHGEFEYGNYDSYKLVIYPGYERNRDEIKESITA